MRFYRVSYSTDGGNSGGFSWHHSYREALDAAQRDYDQDPAEYDHSGTPNIHERIDCINIKPTRISVLDALTRFASHPDNG